MNLQNKNLTLLLATKSRYIFYFTLIGFFSASSLLIITLLSGMSHKFMTIGVIVVLPVFLLIFFTLHRKKVILASYLVILAELIGCVVATTLEFSPFLVFIFIFILSNIFIMVDANQVYFSFIILILAFLFKVMLLMEWVTIPIVMEENNRKLSLIFTAIFFFSIIIYSKFIFELVHKGLTDSDSLIEARNKLEKRNREMEELMIRDTLTEINNRMFFFKEGNKELKRAQQFNHPLSLLLIDLDYFKSINDTYGHHTGDKALITFCRSLEPLLGEFEYFSRIGGEEFTILLPEVSLKNAILKAEMFRKTIESVGLELDNQKIQLTISIGVVEILAEDKKIESVLKRADKNLYLAKRKGRNCIHAG